MAQWLRTLPALSEDSSLVPSSHVEQLTTAFNSDSKGSDALFRSPQLCTHTAYIHKDTHTQK